MSDRTLPPHTFGLLLRDAARRMRVLEGRARWPGHIQSSIVTIDNYQVPPTSYIPQEITFLDLDPGRWVIHGLGSQTIEGIDIPTVVPDLWPSLQVIVDWESEAPDAQSDTVLDETLIIYAAGQTMAAQNRVSMSVQAETPSRLSLSVATAMFPFNDYDFLWYLHSFGLFAIPA